jgi:hypothetical protein
MLCRYIYLVALVNDLENDLFLIWLELLTIVTHAYPLLVFHHLTHTRIFVMEFFLQVHLMHYLTATCNLIEENNALGNTANISQLLLPTVIY